MDDKTSFNKDNMNFCNIICLQDSAIGFYLASRMLDAELRKSNGLERVRLQAPYYSNLLFTIEIFFKIALLKEGLKLQNLKTHKIYDLYKKLNPKTQNNFKSEIDGSNKYLCSLEKALEANNSISIRARYNDLTESASLIFQHFEVLEGLVSLLYEKYKN